MTWMAVIAIHQLLFYFTYSGLTDQYPHLLGLSRLWPVLHGPFLFLYVSAVTQEKPLRARQVLPHFIPFLILAVLAIPFYLLSGAEKIVVFAANGRNIIMRSRMVGMVPPEVISNLVYREVFG